MRALGALVLSCLALACGNTNGGHCTMTAECQNGLVCLPTSVPGHDGGATNPDQRLCMRLCDYDAGDGVEQHLCSDGAACLTIEGMRVCYLGGTHPIRTACADDTQCEPGTVCAPDTLLCTQACTVGTDAPCATGEICIGVGGGICRTPMVVAGDAGM